MGESFRTGQNDVVYILASRGYFHE